MIPTTWSSWLPLLPVVHNTLLDAVDVGDRIRELEVDHDECDIVQASCDDRASH